MLKNHGAIDIDGLNLSDVRNPFSNVKAACTDFSTTDIIFLFVVISMSSRIDSCQGLI